MRRRILDLFKSKDKSRKAEKETPKVTESPKLLDKFQSEKKVPSRWVIAHNQFQAQQANKLRKRRKANKVARKQRQINRKAA